MGRPWPVDNVGGAVDYVGGTQAACSSSRLPGDGSRSGCRARRGPGPYPASGRTGVNLQRRPMRRLWTYDGVAVRFRW
ncbi:hypothetical protein FrEUN1fDRAFT_1129 [Parafrankia sp. EUN1f]|nr:hypothetical protein FrEUN1fDRAFT_1129 [Parafrankia sp. EUN1f]